MARPRGRPRIPDELRPQPPPPKPSKLPKRIPSKGPGRAKRERPLTAEEIEERRIRYKGDKFKQDYARLYQQCYYQRPEIKYHKTEYKKKKRSEEREARTPQ